MKFWLILMLFTQDGKFIGKMESDFDAFGSCAIAAGAVTAEFVNTGTKIQAWCVSDDHYNGIEQDEGIPLDLIGAEDE
jgi:hypothetical protein